MDKKTEQKNSQDKIAIAIDGPAGAGKSTIARLVAKSLGFIYVDTGAMYRAMACYFLAKGAVADDRERIEELCKEASVTITYLDGEQHVWLNGKDITKELRTEAVSHMASVSSTYAKVRDKLLELQRELAGQHNVVMDGRDIGTRILPGAKVKIYMTASIKERAERRYKEMMEKGIACDLKTIERDIAERDERDMNREIAPLRQAEDAILIDTSDMNIQEAAEAVIKEYEQKDKSYGMKGLQ